MKLFFLCSLIILATIAHAQPKIGDVSPEIELASNKGNSIRLSSLRGKIVLIDFWASWCGPCRRAIHEILPLYEKYNARGFEIYGISLDDNVAEWKRAIAQDKSNWLHVNDNRGAASTLARAWKIYQIPTSYLLDEMGRVVAIDPGKKEIEAYLKQNLKNVSAQ